MVRCLLGLLLVPCLLLPVVAQDDPPANPAADTPPPATAEPAAQTEPATQPDATPPEPAAQPEPTDAKPADSAAEALAAYQALFDQWKQLLDQLRELQTQYKTAKPADRGALKTQFDELLAQGEQLYGRLQEAARAAYQADPQNPDLAEFMGFLLDAEFRNDEYDKALALAELLIANQYRNKRVYDLAGRAAFNVSQFDKAEQYLTEAENNSAIDDEGQRYLSVLPQTKQAWQRELELRAAEAKADDLPRVRLKTNKGDIVVELFENEAPNTVANFISLVEKEYYDDTPFHRVLAGFMAQGGDPTGTGSGSPGYRIACECYEPDHRVHFQGSLSMAKGTPRDTGGSQFFLTFKPTTHLDGLHTVFGRIIEGIDVLPKLQRRDPQVPPLPTPDRIVKATVERKRDHEYKPETLPE